jgi:glycerol-3-phosphate acyltransferase PlsX
VALLSNGHEPDRGPEVVVAAHRALAERPGGLEFVGNVEGFAIGKGTADVIVADGFAGNVALKVMEGTTAALFEAVRAAADVDDALEAGGALLRPALRALRDQLDPQEQGGAFLLGLRRLGVVPARLLRRARLPACDRARGPRACARNSWPARTIASRRRARDAGEEASAAVASVPEP